MAAHKIHKALKEISFTGSPVSKSPKIPSIKTRCNVLAIYVRVVG
nr:MAG TPA: hypothetical protein [Caudoviricetes sp.]